MPRNLTIGGLGGGGDVGLTAILVKGWRAERKVKAVLSFARCKAGRRGIGEPLAGALVRVEPGSSLGPWARETLILYTENPLGKDRGVHQVASRQATTGLCYMR